MISESDACKIFCAARDASKAAFSLDKGKSEVVVSLPTLALILRDMCDEADSGAIGAIARFGKLSLPNDIFVTLDKYNSTVDALARLGNVNTLSADEIIAALEKCDSEGDFICTQENRTCSPLNGNDDSSSGEIEMGWSVGETQ